MPGSSGIIWDSEMTNPGSKLDPSREGRAEQGASLSQASGWVVVPFSKRENTDLAKERAQVSALEKEMSSVSDMLNVRCLWDIPVDVSRKQMARTAGLDLQEEVRPEPTALKDSRRVEQQRRSFEGTEAQRKKGEDLRDTVPTPGEDKKEEPMGEGTLRRNQNATKERTNESEFRSTFPGLSSGGMRRLRQYSE